MDSIDLQINGDVLRKPLCAHIARCLAGSWSNWRVARIGSQRRILPRDGIRYSLR